MQTLSELRFSLRQTEDAILKAAPRHCSHGMYGGDIEAACRARSVPRALKAQRLALKAQIRALSETAASQSNPQASIIASALRAALDDMEAMLPYLRTTGWQVHNEEATIRRGRRALQESTQ